MVDLHELLHGALSRNEEGFYSYSTGTGDGVSVSFPFSFVGIGKAYLRDSDIHVFLRDSNPNSTGYNTFIEILDTFSFPTENIVTLTTVVSAPTDGEPNLRIRRIMPKDAPYADVETDAIFRREVLNNSSLQSLYVVHEGLDGFLGQDTNVIDEIEGIYKSLTRILRVSDTDPVSEAGLIIPLDRTDKIMTFDSEGNLVLRSSTTDNNTLIEEPKTLASGQTEVIFSTINVNESAFYVSNTNNDRGRLFKDKDYTITNSTTIELTSSYPVGTVCLGITNDFAGSSIRAELEENKLNDAIYNTQVGTTYTLEPVDRGATVDMTNNSPNIINLETNAIKPIPVNSVIKNRQIGAGVTTLQAVVGVTLNGIDGGSVVFSNQYDVAEIDQRAVNEWIYKGVGLVS